MQGIDGWLYDRGDLKPPLLRELHLILKPVGLFLLHQQWNPTRTKAELNHQPVIDNIPESHR